MTEKEMLQNAAFEIKDLRRSNNEMRLRLRMFDDLMTLFVSKPNLPSEGYSEDLVWKIERHLKENTSTPATT